VPDQNLSDLLLDVVRALDPITEQALTAGRGATLSQLAVLRALDGGQLSVSAIAHIVGVNRSSISRMVNRMLVMGLVEKQPSPTNGREGVVTATADGRSAAASVARSRRQRLDERLRTMTPEEQIALQSALRILRRSLKTSRDTSGGD
jgi:DNA-binding MarR family transcriptional regulator